MATVVSAPREAIVRMVGVPDAVQGGLESALADYGLRGTGLAGTIAAEYRPAGLVVALESPATGWDEIIEGSVTAAWSILRASIPGLLRDGPGSIVICCPALGNAGGDVESSVATAVARHALVGLVRCLANELGPARVRVNAVAPQLASWAPGTLQTIAWLLSPLARHITGAVLGTAAGEWGPGEP